MRDNGITSGQEPNTNTAQNNLSQNDGSHCTGNIKVIGIGPGGERVYDASSARSHLSG